MKSFTSIRKTKLTIKWKESLSSILQCRIQNSFRRIHLRWLTLSDSIAQIWHFIST